MNEFQKPEMKQSSEYTWDIPQTYKKGMNVPARIYASKKLLEGMDNSVYNQLTNVACLPGIVKHALCMPDGHSGYGFPIGGVAAFDPNTGVISPGGIGFDINCGMRLVTTNLTYNDMKPHLKKLVDLLYTKVPSGVGGTGFVKVDKPKFREAMSLGAKLCVAPKKPLQKKTLNQ